MTSIHDLFQLENFNLAGFCKNTSLLLGICRFKGRRLKPKLAILRLIIIGCILQLSLSLKASGQPSVPLKSGVLPGRYMSLYEDKQQALQKTELFANLDKFWPSTSDHPNFRITSADTWGYFTINKGPTDPAEWYLEHAYALTDFVYVYHFHEGELLAEYVLGDQLPYQERPIDFRHVIFRLNLQTGTNHFFVKIHTKGPNRMPFILWDPAGLRDRLQNESLILGLGFGIALIMIAYNGFLSISLRSRSYFLYTAFGLAFFVFQLSMQGMGGKLGFLSVDQEIWFSNWGFLLGSNVCTLLGLAFSLTFLNLTTTSQKLARAYYVMMLAFIPSITLILLRIDYHISALASNYLVGLATLLMIGTGIHFTLRRYRPAYYYTAAWSFVAGGALMLSLSNAGVLPAQEHVTYATFFGWCIELALLSLALADRVRWIERSRIDDKNNYIAELQQSQKEIQHSYSQLEKIVYQHQISQIQQGKRLEETMPVGQSEATLLCFDIIRSTELLRQGYKSFITDVVSACNQIILDSYDATGPSASAFRIFEAGDGFICSIGFPFQTNGKISDASQAFHLAFEFLHAFQRLKDERLPNVPVYCAMGLAMGPVTAFYPQVGTKDFQLYGKGIVLANRYESARNMLFKYIPQQDVISVQADVYNRLTDDEQQMLQRFDLKRHGETIRDDGDQQAVFYFAGSANKIVDPPEKLIS
jgi:class 3 adenylate cyclase